MSSPTPTSDLARALADPNRIQILDLLSAGELCVCDITAELDLSQPLLSFHLKTLREAGLVHDRREGRWVHYSLCTDKLHELARWLDRLTAPQVGVEDPHVPPGERLPPQRSLAPCCGAARLTQRVQLTRKQSLHGARS